MKRREFVSRACAGVVALSPALSWPRRYAAAPWLLVPMDDAQSNHLKAYGLTYRALKREFALDDEALEEVKDTIKKEATKKPDVRVVGGAKSRAART